MALVLLSKKVSFKSSLKFIIIGSDHSLESEHLVSSKWLRKHHFIYGSGWMCLQVCPPIDFTLLDILAESKLDTMQSSETLRLRIFDITR